MVTGTGWDAGAGERGVLRRDQQSGDSGPGEGEVTALELGGPEAARPSDVRVRAGLAEPSPLFGLAFLSPSNSTSSLLLSFLVQLPEL